MLNSQATTSIWARSTLVKGVWSALISGSFSTRGLSLVLVIVSLLGLLGLRDLQRQLKMHWQEKRSLIASLYQEQSRLVLEKQLILKQVNERKQLLRFPLAEEKSYLTVK